MSKNTNSKWRFRASSAHDSSREVATIRFYFNTVCLKIRTQKTVSKWRFRFKTRPSIDKVATAQTARQVFDPVVHFSRPYNVQKLAIFSVGPIKFPGETRQPTQSSPDAYGPAPAPRSSALGAVFHGRRRKQRKWKGVASSQRASAG